MTDWGDLEREPLPADWSIPMRWEIAPTSHAVHAAVYPRQLAYRCLQLWSGFGDVICDPFCGVGTTGYVAALLGRRFVGIEQGAVVAEIAAENLSNAVALYENNKPKAWKAIEKIAGGDVDQWLSGDLTREAYDSQDRQHRQDDAGDLGDPRRSK